MAKPPNYIHTFGAHRSSRVSNDMDCELVLKVRIAVKMYETMCKKVFLHVCCKLLDKVCARVCPTDLKGQLISKAKSTVFIRTKKRTKIFYFSLEDILLCGFEPHSRKYFFSEMFITFSFELKKAF